MANNALDRAEGFVQGWRRAKRASRTRDNQPTRNDTGLEPDDRPSDPQRDRLAGSPDGALCAELKDRGCETLVSKRAGLLLDPYFSATKIAWILDNVPGARTEAERGDLAFGTVDSFLVWCLTSGKVHVTDSTNASRTLLFNIHSGAWDDDLLALFRIPRSMLPKVKDCAAEFGEAAAEHLGVAIPIRGIAGDQQAALIGQACFRPGMVKSTYGTGCFALANTGDKAVEFHA